MKPVKYKKKTIQENDITYELVIKKSEKTEEENFNTILLE